LETSQQELPEEGELVFITVKEITPHGVYVVLEEYDGIQAFLHVSEIAQGWVKNIYRFVRLGQKIVLKVIKVNKSRQEVNVSRRQVTPSERRKKIVATKQIEKAKKIMEQVQNKTGIDNDTIMKYSDNIIDEFGSLYRGLEEISKDGQKFQKKLNFPEDFFNVLEPIVKERVTPPSVEKKGTIQLTSKLPNGIAQIKSALLQAEKVKTDGAKVKITYIGSPKYQISVQAENYKIAEKVLENCLQIIRESVDKKTGNFVFLRA
jgi:translation initiation factor 2 subunit 1